MSRIRPNAAASRTYFVPKDCATIVSTTALQNDRPTKGFPPSEVQEVRDRVRRGRGWRVRSQPQAGTPVGLGNDRPGEGGRGVGSLQFGKRTDRGRRYLLWTRWRLPAPARHASNEEGI